MVFLLNLFDVNFALRQVALPRIVENGDFLEQLAFLVDSGEVVVGLFLPVCVHFFDLPLPLHQAFDFGLDPRQHLQEVVGDAFLGGVDQFLEFGEVLLDVEEQVCFFFV